MESGPYRLTPYCTLRSLAVAGRTAGSGILLQGLLEACEIAGPRIVPVVAMVRRVRPVLDVGDEPVLDWIEPSVVDVVRVVPIVADRVLPVAALPDPALPTYVPAHAERLACDNGLREAHLYQAPSEREIAIAFRQGPEACIWSGRTTMASISNGKRWRVSRTASRKAPMRSTKRRCPRLRRLTVKNHEAPAMNARR